MPEDIDRRFHLRHLATTVRTVEMLLDDGVWEPIGLLEDVSCSGIRIWVPSHHQFPKLEYVCLRIAGKIELPSFREVRRDREEDGSLFIALTVYLDPTAFGELAAETDLMMQLRKAM